MHVNSDDLTRTNSAGLWSALIAPRPVFLVATQNADGICNIAPYSSVALISVNPPMVSISFGEGRGRRKNTLANILATRHFSLNVVPRSLAAIANTSAEGVSIEDDFDRLELTRTSFTRSPAQSIAESPASIACELVQLIAIEGSSSSLILCRCSEVIFDDHFSIGASFDPVSADLIASIGVEDYISLKGEAFTLPKPRE